jgi:hypothetical protein
MSKPIKSTLELAMEKAAKLPKLTKQEIRERQEKEFAPLGRAIARKFLTDELEETRLRTEMFEHEDERGEIVRRAFAKCICQSIDLDDAKTATKVFQGTRALAWDARFEETENRLGGIYRDYEGQRQRELAAKEAAENARVRDMGISGSAIRVNLQENESWRQRLCELRREFRPKVDEIRRELTDRLVSSCAERGGAGARDTAGPERE